MSRQVLTESGLDPLAVIRGRPIEVLIREDVKMSTAWIAVETFGELGFEARLVTDADFHSSADIGTHTWSRPFRFVNP